MNQQSTISEVISEYLPERFRFRCGDTTFGVSAVGGLVLLVFVAVNFGSSAVWLFGASVGVPLSVQWLLAFVAGGVVSLRVKHVHQLRLARALAERGDRAPQRGTYPASRPAVLAPPLRSTAGASRLGEPGHPAAPHRHAVAGPAYSQRVG